MPTTKQIRITLNYESCKATTVAAREPNKPPLRFLCATCIQIKFRPLLRILHCAKIGCEEMKCFRLECQ